MKIKITDFCTLLVFFTLFSLKTLSQHFALSDFSFWDSHIEPKQTQVSQLSCNCIWQRRISFEFWMNDNLFIFLQIMKASLHWLWNFALPYLVIILFWEQVWWDSKPGERKGWKSTTQWPNTSILGHIFSSWKLFWKPSKVTSKYFFLNS